MSLSLRSKRPARLSSKTNEPPSDNTRGSVSSGPLKSPVGRPARFTLFGRKRTSTSTNASTNKDGSFSGLPQDAQASSFHTFNGGKDEEFEFSREFGKIESLPRSSDLKSTVSSAASSKGGSGGSLNIVLTPRVSELKAKPGAPIYIGKAGHDEAASKSSSRASSPTVTSPSHDSSKMHLEPPMTKSKPVVQSYMSRHKVPDVMRKLDGSDAPAFEWPAQPPAYAVQENDLFNDDLDLPPPPKY